MEARKKKMIIWISIAVAATVGLVLWQLIYFDFGKTEYTLSELRKDANTDIRPVRITVRYKSDCPPEEYSFDISDGDDVSRLSDMLLTGTMKKSRPEKGCSNGSDLVGGSHSVGYILTDANGEQLVVAAKYRNGDFIYTNVNMSEIIDFSKEMLQKYDPDNYDTYSGRMN